jgi:hypothetical protein
MVKLQCMHVICHNVIMKPLICANNIHQPRKNLYDNAKKLKSPNHPDNRIKLVTSHHLILSVAINLVVESG